MAIKNIDSLPAGVAMSLAALIAIGGVNSRLARTDESTSRVEAPMAATSAEPVGGAMRVAQVELQPNAFAAGGADDGPEFAYLGSKRCRLCHNEPTDQGFAASGAAPNALAGKPSDWVRLCEATIWSRDDKHALAYQLLDSPRGRQIAENLGGPAATERNDCLSCHSGATPDVLAAHMAGGRDADAIRIELLQDGVSCEACHGPSSAYDTPHTALAWREIDPARKHREFGMVDVRNHATRAALCASCHVGNVEQGKFVTHDMYAAGHPPLPAFEIETFVDHMPRHWQTAREKASDETALRWLREHYNFDPSEPAEAKAVVLGALAALRESVASLVAQAAGESGVWPDFANYDCAACHHDLGSPSWRQSRGYAGKPGRPPFRAWPEALVLAGMPLLDDSIPASGGLASLVEQFELAIVAQPFGDRDRIKTSGRALIDWIDAQTASLSRRTLGEAEMLVLLESICRVGQSNSHDFESSRQLAWAFRKLCAAASTDEAFAARVDQLVANQLQGPLQLALPAGQAFAGQPYEDHLSHLLKVAGDYDPQQTQAAFAELAELLARRRAALNATQ